MKGLFDRSETRALLVLLAAFLLQWLLLFSAKPPTWDAVSYYVYARSVVFDGDLDLANDYRLSYPTATPDFAAKQLDQNVTTTGRVANVFAIGSAVLWIPWLALLRLFATVASSGAALSGYEPLFTVGVATLSALLGFLTFWLGWCLSRTVSSGTAALAAALTLMFATPLLHYQFREPLYSHVASAFTVGLVVFVWWRQEDPVAGPWRAFGLGALIGLAGLARWQNLMYLALPLTGVVYSYLSARRPTPSSAGRYLFLVALGTAAVFSLQLAVWSLLYGSFLLIPQGSGFLDWRAPYLVPLLSSSFRGLLPWMPVFFLAAIGLVMLAKRHPQRGLPLLVLLLLALYVNASTRDWFAGGAFGPRRLTSELVLLVIGYGVFLDLIPRRWRTWSAALLGLILTLHQWLLLRYALAERLGGRVLSMIPDFQWEDVPLPQFFRDLLGLLPRLWQEPFNAFVFPFSPLHLLLREQRWPAVQILALLLTGLVLLLLVLALRRIDWARLQPRRAWPYLLVLLLLVAAANVTLLLFM